MNKTKMASVLAVALALVLVTGCASSPKEEQQPQARQQMERQQPEQQRQNEERAKLAEGAAKAKPLSFRDTVPHDSLWYSIQPAENNTVTVYTGGNPTTTIKAYDSNMNLIAENTGSSASSPNTDRNARLEFPVEAGKTYYLYAIPLRTMISSEEREKQSVITAEPKAPAGTLTGGESMVKNAELKPIGTLTDGKSMVINGVTISYSEGLISMTNNSGKAARVRYGHEGIVVSQGETQQTGEGRRSTGRRSTGGAITFNAGSTSETRPSWDNPPKEIRILEVVLIEPENQ